jgi:hypothetical protein
LVRAALAMKLQSEIGLETIATREHAALQKAFARWQSHPRIDVLGPADPERRIGIVSFNLRDESAVAVPPRLVTTLLNDLFGIQSRAGCSCAGPYGHALLGIGEDETQAIRRRVLDGETGARPGWCRVSLHWTMDADELDYLIAAVEFLADHAGRFAGLYRCDARTGSWTWNEGETPLRCALPASLLGTPDLHGLKPSPCPHRAEALRLAAFESAHTLARRLERGETV